MGEGTNIGGLDHEVIAVNPLAWADEKFSRYIEERRENPRDDVLTSIATAKYPDGSTPEVVDVVRTATFLFAAGPGDDREAARRGDADARRPARHPAAAARRPQPHPGVRRGMPADGQPGEERVPDGPQDNDTRRHSRACRDHGDGQPRRRQPRPQPVREPARVLTRPQERPRAHRVQPRHPLLPGRPARAGGGPGLDRATSSTGWPTSPSTRRSTGRSTPGSTSTSRRSSCAGSPRSTSSSRPSARTTRSPAAYRSPRSHLGKPSSRVTHVRNRPSGAWATSPS